MRTAILAENVWDDASLAEMLRSEARDLRERFGRDYWTEDRGYYALALDRESRRIDSITSNPGHLLWSGIVPEEKVRLMVDWLMGEELFSGWGVRTMAAEEGRYDPNSYHNGSVWPHDNAIIAAGLGRYGFQREANRIGTAIFEAAALITDCPKFSPGILETKSTPRSSTRPLAARRRGPQAPCRCSCGRC